VTVRAFSDMTGLVRRGATKLGEEWWHPGAPGRALGFEVLRFTEPADLQAFVRLHEEAHLWIHRDYDHDAWLVLDVDEPHEVGTDFVMMTRRPGVNLPRFFPETSDDPVPAPDDRLTLLHGVLDTLLGVASAPLDQYIAKLVRDRVHARDYHVVYDPDELRFYIDNLDPDPAELAAWRTVMPPA
jgi:hypothetical protein